MIAGTDRSEGRSVESSAHKTSYHDAIAARRFGGITRFVSCLYQLFTCGPVLRVGSNTDGKCWKPIFYKQRAGRNIRMLLTYSPDEPSMRKEKAHYPVKAGPFIPSVVDPMALVCRPRSLHLLQTHEQSCLSTRNSNLIPNAMHLLHPCIQ